MCSLRILLKHYNDHCVIVAITTGVKLAPECIKTHHFEGENTKKIFWEGVQPPLQTSPPHFGSGYPLPDPTSASLMSPLETPPKLHFWLRAWCHCFLAGTQFSWSETVQDRDVRSTTAYKPLIGSHLPFANCKPCTRGIFLTFMHRLTSFRLTERVARSLKIANS